MKFLYDDESFSFEALRAAGYAAYNGADLGEVLVTCRQIPEGNETAWSAQSPREPESCGWAKTMAGRSRIGTIRDAHAAAGLSGGCTQRT